jgi:hypothetical protein
MKTLNKGDKPDEKLVSKVLAAAEKIAKSFGANTPKKEQKEEK